MSALQSLLRPTGDWASLLFLLGVASLAFAPQYVLRDMRLWGQELTTVHHLLVLLCGIPLLLQRGLRQWWSPIFIVYGILLITTFTLAQRPPELSTLQPFRSLFAFLLAPLLFQINLSSKTAYRVVQIVAWWHISNSLLGLLFLPISGRALLYIDFLGVWRWQGGSDTSDFAISAVLAVIACCILARRQPRYYFLAILASVLIFLTLSRVPFAVVLVVWLIVGITQWQAMRRDFLPLLRRSALWLVPLLLGIALWGGQSLVTRTFYNPTYQADIEISETVSVYSSGRLDAWRWNWERALTSPLFGLGVGAGTIPFPDNSATFRTPLNEFLRVLVDGGFVGLGLVLAAYGYTFWWAWRRTPTPLRPYVLCLLLIYGAAFAFFNALSNQQFAVNFWVLLSACITPYLLERVEGAPVPNDADEAK